MTVHTFLHPQSLFESDVLSNAEDPLIVVSDVMFFSTTTTILGEQGVERVTPIQSLSDVEENIPLGGEFKSEDISVDFQNRPQSVFGFIGMQETTPSHVQLHSTNGARVIRQISERVDESSEIIIGCLRNASSVAEYIQSHQSHSSVFLVSAGSRDEIAIEDQLCISSIDQYLGGRPVNEVALSELSQTLPIQRYDPEMSNVDSYFQPDDRQHASRINESDFIPRLTGGRDITFES